MPKSPALHGPEVMASIALYNAGRNPERLALKFAKMAQSPFVFLRGASHLFYEALPDIPLFREAPLAWACGDLHFENFGSYKGDNRQVYFDINDFDEAALAPVTWDLVRLLTSLQCGVDALNATASQDTAASERCMAAYRTALGNGKPLWVEKETSVGMVKDLLMGLKDRNRVDFLNKRTQTKNQHHRQLKLDGVKGLPVSDLERGRVTRFMATFATAHQRDDFPNYYNVLDVGCRIAGTGSLGLDRYVVLVEGKGSPDGNYLLDIKEAKPSAMADRLIRFGLAQPEWPDEASRVVAVQKRMQAVDHAFLWPVCLEGRAFILRGLQPSEDRVTMGGEGQKLDRLNEVAATLGQVLAWDQLRASSRSGSASADALMDFARRDDWGAAMLHAATTMTAITKSQWKVFTKSRSAST